MSEYFNTLGATWNPVTKELKSSAEVYQERRKMNSITIDGIEWTPDGPEDKAQTRRIVNQWEIDGLELPILHGNQAGDTERATMRYIKGLLND